MYSVGKGITPKWRSYARVGNPDAWEAHPVHLALNQKKGQFVSMYEILDFIHRRWRKDANWLDGNCYWFARILQTRFPFLELYYLPIDGHFVCGDGENFYDWTGVVQLEEIPFLFSDIEKQEPMWYERIWRDCVL